MSAPPMASVVIPTRNRAASLSGCLESILSDSSAAELEIIVVDNGSTDETHTVVSAAADASRRHEIRHVVEEETGSSAARNRGVAEAGGDVILFTDDDVLVADGWADGLIAGFAEAGVGAVGGRILPSWASPPPAWMNGPHAELLTLIDYGLDSRLLAADEPPLSANMAVRADVLRQFSPPFDTRLGHRGDRRMAHEEVHLINRVREAGHSIAYRADAVAYHRVAPERMNLDFMRSTIMDLGRGLAKREHIEGVAQLTIPVRAVRTWRTCRAARRLRRSSERGTRFGPETWDELYAYMWAGKHIEMLLGRAPLAADLVARVAVRIR